jgi:hypothetical protein
MNTTSFVKTRKNKIASFPPPKVMKTVCEVCPNCGVSVEGRDGNVWRYCWDCEREGCCQCLGSLELAAYYDREPTCIDCVHGGQLLLFPLGREVCPECLLPEGLCRACVSYQETRRARTS